MEERPRRRLPRHSRQPIERGAVYYYAAAQVDGQNVLNGPHTIKDDAYQWGYNNLEGDWDVVELPTRDMRRANQIMRDRNIQNGQSIRQVLKRTKHKF